MYLARNFLVVCLVMLFMLGADAASGVTNFNSAHGLGKIDGKKSQTTATPRRKREPFDPVKHPPEVASDPNVTPEPSETFSRCLPQGIAGSDVVSVLPTKPGAEAKTITVNQKLRQLKARCRRGKLVDASGRAIYFFQMAGCWGNPPEDYQQILDEQAAKIAQLKKRYTVVEMTCNPSGMLIP